MMISLYIFIKYFLTQKDPPVYELIILGLCFAVAFFLRINHFSLWLGFCIVIVIESLQKHKFLQLSKYIMFFSAGILIVAIPLILYLYINNAFFDYINQNFGMGTSRAFYGFSIKRFVESIFLIVNGCYTFLPFLVYFTWIVKKHKNVNIYLASGLLLAYLLTVFFIAVIRTSYGQYNMLFTPFLVPAFTLCVKTCSDYFANIKYKNIILFLFVCVIFSGYLLLWGKSGYSVIKDTSRRGLISVGKYIGQITDVDDKIYCCAAPASIYLFTKRQPATRYFYYFYKVSGNRLDITGIDSDPNAQKEFIQDLRENKPKIIVIEERDYKHFYDLPEWYRPVYDIIANEYRLMSAENELLLFIRENAH